MLGPPMALFGFHSTGDERGQYGPGLRHESVLFGDTAGSRFVAVQLVTLQGVTGLTEWVQILFREGGGEQDLSVSIWEMTRATVGFVDTAPYVVQGGVTTESALAFAITRLLLDGEGFLRGDLATFRRAIALR